MLNNFIYAQTKDLFLDNLEAGNILDEAIVFIEDTKEIWNHGHYFGREDAAVINSKVDKSDIKTINGQPILGSGDLTIEGGAKIYEWFYDGESESVTLSQEEYDNIIEADLVVVNVAGTYSLTVSKTGKEFSEAVGRYALIGQLEVEGIKLYININIEISTKVATITVEEQEILTKTSQLENDSNFVTSDNLKTINGESILGGGDLTISQSKISIVNHGSSDTNFTLTAGVLHKWSDINNLTLNIPEDVDGTCEEYSVVFSTGDGFSLTIPAKFRWQNNTIPTFESNKEYELNIRDGKVLCSMFNAPPPSGVFLTYIENDGSDYILTDIMIDSNMYGVSYKAASLLNKGGTHYVLAGARTTAGSTANTSCMCWFLNTGNRDIYWNGSSNKIGSYSSGTIYEDSRTEIQNNIAPGYPLTIFAGNDAGVIKYNGTFRIFNIKLLDINNNAIIDLRPFRKDSGVIGLLDIVNNKFYTSVNGNLIGVE